MTLRALLPLALLGGCLNANSFSAKVIAVTCERYEECFAAEFEAEFDDQKECRDDLEDYQSDCFADHCEFNAKAAGDCIAGIRKQSCEALGEGDSVGSCTDVWEDCDEIALGLCLAGEGIGFDTF